jgi:serine/threonine-protein kinase HipA
VTAPVEGLNLWYDDQVVAQVFRTAPDFTSLRLSYQPEWVAHPSAFPISVRFPLRDAPYEAPEVYFWFLNLLPEGEALTLIGQLLDVSDLDVLGLMTQMGGDLPGALIARRPEEPFMPGTPHVRTWDEAGLANDIRRLSQRPLLAGEEGVQMSLAGQQDKLAVVKLADGKLALPLDGYASTHILKPASKQLYGSVENEAFCMRLAAACGVPAAEVETGRVEDQDYLLVRRYDRATQAGATMRLHQEDLCQALALPPYRKYEWNARVRQSGPTVAKLFEAVSVGPRTLPNRLALLDMVIFNVLCCNVDAHAKNYSLLHNGKTPAMAPLYDVMCGAVYEGITKNLSQKIVDKQRGDHIYGRHWVRFADDIGMSAPQVRRRVSTLAKKVEAEADSVAERLQANLSQPKFVVKVAEAIKARSRRILANLDDAGSRNGLAERAEVIGEDDGD